MGQRCDSCGMPLTQDPKGGGTQADGSLSTTYCSYCYAGGDFLGERCDGQRVPTPSNGGHGGKRQPPLESLAIDAGNSAPSPLAGLTALAHDHLNSTHEDDPHFITRSNWLRAAVLGANDGILSVAALIVGVAAADPGLAAVLLAGAAGLIAGRDVDGGGGICLRQFTIG